MPLTHLSDDERMAQWAAQYAHVEAAIKQQSLLYERIRQSLQPFWEHLAEGKTFTRKPSFGLRLLAADAQLLVALSPWYTYRPKAVHAEQLVLDVILEVERYLRETHPTPLYQLDRSLSLLARPEGTTRRMLSSRCATETVDALTTLLTQFLADPEAVLRRSIHHCSICGRELTDGQSQARGVGPECLKHMSSLLCVETSIFGSMETMADWEQARSQ